MAKIKLTKVEQNRQQKRSGFTLLELIIVIIIIGALTSLALPKLFNIIKGAKATEVVVAIGSIRSAMERCYLMQNGTYKGCDSGATPASCGSVGWGGRVPLDDPSSSPGSQFCYGVTIFDDRSYAICATTKNAPIYFGDSYYICLGLGVEADINDEGGLTNFTNHGDEKKYWDGPKWVRGFLPNTN